jgi:hypothetical protein
MTVHTHPYYWDCECDKDFIHAKDTCHVCNLCGANKDDQPDSHYDEVVKAGFTPTYDDC